MVNPDLEREFPGLKPDNYEITSPASPSYNCIAWAASRDDAWWEPDPLDLYFWPTNVPRRYTLDAYMQAFTTLGFVVCDCSDLEAGFEKVVIYAKPNGSPTHAARQLRTGAWTSKLGRAEDIEHETMIALKGHQYGAPVLYLRRPLRD
jgi:hypothetical protein